jgi:hypothetical protein
VFRRALFDTGEVRIVAEGDSAHCRVTASDADWQPSANAISAAPFARGGGILDDVPDTLEYPLESWARKTDDEPGHCAA